jgi:predicted Fe-Mo cluster-binding NifX family protein
MKLGVGTSDGAMVCDHLAHSAAFVVFDVEDGRIAGQTVRQRGSGVCGNHATFVEMLAGCSTVLCGGIGQGAVNSLTAAGIEPLVLAQSLTIDDAVAQWLAGSLVTTDARKCLCG